MKKIFALFLLAELMVLSINFVSAIVTAPNPVGTNCNVLIVQANANTLCKIYTLSGSFVKDACTTSNTGCCKADTNSMVSGDYLLNCGGSKVQFAVLAGISCASSNLCNSNSECGSGKSCINCACVSNACSDCTNTYFGKNDAVGYATDVNTCAVGDTRFLCASQNWYSCDVGLNENWQTKRLSGNIQHNGKYDAASKDWFCLSSKWYSSSEYKGEIIYYAGSSSQNYDLVAADNTATSSGATLWYYCDAHANGENLGPNGLPLNKNQIISINKGSGAHDYMCYDNGQYESIAECCGNNTCYNKADPFGGLGLTTGERIGNYVCYSDSTFKSCPAASNTEVCGDKIDNNCNGRVEEGCDLTAPSATIYLTSPSGRSATTGVEVFCSDNVGGSGCSSGTYKILIYNSLTTTCPSDYSLYTQALPASVSQDSWICGAAKDLAGNAGFTSAPTEWKKLPAQVSSVYWADANEAKKTTAVVGAAVKLVAACAGCASNDNVVFEVKEADFDPTGFVNPDDVITTLTASVSAGKAVASWTISQENWTKAHEITEGAEEEFYFIAYTSANSGIKLDTNKEGERLIVTSTGDYPLTASITSPTTTLVTSPVIFTQTSQDLDDEITSYSWSFGADANPATSTNANPAAVTYPVGGPKDITLTVKNSKGELVIATKGIEVDIPGVDDQPRAEIICTQTGNTVSCDASGSTDDTKTLNKLLFTWKVDNKEDEQCLKYRNIPTFSYLFNKAGPHEIEVIVDDSDPVDTASVILDILEQTEEKAGYSNYILAGIGVTVIVAVILSFLIRKGRKESKKGKS